jgi:hypothetical protein
MVLEAAKGIALRFPQFRRGARDTTAVCTTARFV